MAEASVPGPEQAEPDYPLLAYIGGKFREVFGIDIRSLALFRMGLALVILGDLWVRALDLECFYADSGVLPRRDLLDLYPEPYHFSVHLLSGLWQVQAFLFLIAAVFAVMLLVGYRTRLATILSWFLLVSLDARNQLVEHGGDIVLRCLLFWGMFLPLGASYSLDRARDSSGRAPPRSIFSAATLALLLQVAFIYIFTALKKTDPTWRTEGSAVWYSLSLEGFSTSLGRYLLNYPGLLTSLTFATLYLEMFGPFLAFVPFWNAWFRLTAVVLFFLFHLGLLLTMDVGFFPCICWVGWSAFLPAAFWDFLQRRLPRPTILYDESHDFCRRVLIACNTFFLFGAARLQPTPTEKLVSEPVEPAPLPPEPSTQFSVHHSPLTTHQPWWSVRDSAGKLCFDIAALTYLCRRSWLLWPVGRLLGWGLVARLAATCYAWLAQRDLERWLFLLRPVPLRLRTRLFIAGNVAVGFLLVLVLVWNLRTLDWAPAGPVPFEEVVVLARLEQNWNMFAPKALDVDGWFVLEARLRDGSVVDLMTGSTVTDEKPAIITYASQRWQKYLTNLWLVENVGARQPYMRYLCRKWNAAHARDPKEQVASVKMYYWEKWHTYGAEPNLRKLQLAPPFVPKD
jgi:hypothetical protein